MQLGWQLFNLQFRFKAHFVYTDICDLYLNVVKGWQILMYIKLMFVSTKFAFWAQSANIPNSPLNVSELTESYLLPHMYAWRVKWSVFSCHKVYRGHDNCFCLNVQKANQHVHVTFFASNGNATIHTCLCTLIFDKPCVKFSYPT